jgi:hypothetical protein
MKTRTGKIARLPEPIREQLNQRLLNGVLGKDTIPWLNGLAEVQGVLAEHFGGRPINEHNVSEWRHGGYHDWLRDRETRARVLHLTEEYAHLESNARLSRRVESVMIAELLDHMDQLDRIKNPDLRSARFHRLCRDFVHLQNLRCRGLEVSLQQAKESPSADSGTPEARPLGATRTY